MKLENLNLVELDAREVKETEGGFFGWLVGAMVGGALFEIVNNWSQHQQAFWDGYNQTAPQPVNQ